jgi:hypothetical protein
VSRYLPAIAAIVFSYPQSPSAGIGNKTGKGHAHERTSVSCSHSSRPEHLAGCIPESKAADSTLMGHLQREVVMAPVDHLMRGDS